jgi:hypothetical protein
MPNKTKSSLGEEPQVVSRGKMIFTLALAGVFDFLRAFFVFFVFTGPALATLACTSKVNSAVGTTVASAGGKVIAAVCAGGSTALGTITAPALIAFGLIMADCVSFLGFLTLSMWVLATNLRVIKVIPTAIIQFSASFAASEVPFWGAFPFFSYRLWRIYGAQRLKEKRALKKWQEERAEIEKQEREAAQLRLMQMRAAQETQFAITEAANEEAEMEEQSIQEEQKIEQTQKEKLAGNMGGQGAANDDHYETPSRLQDAA